jgi:AraC family transcriptional regulator, regulatory protein of adaptative response / methylated-DNA-[protein]-cysteine methyltransferase
MLQDDLELTDRLETEDARRMAEAIAYLARNYRSQPSLDEAARVVGLSPFHFQRLFTRWVGVSPKKFVAYLTLEHAKRLLEDSTNVLEAAYDAGLSGPGRLHDLAVTIEALTPGELRERGRGLDISYGFHTSPFGEALVMQTARGVCGLAFADHGREGVALDDMMARWPAAHFVEDQKTARGRVEQIFGREGKVPLVLNGTPWQVKVWEALLRIPGGKTATYEDIAAGISAPSAMRAVGTAVGRNPISWLIPCHRVLKKTGVLGGYHWGPERKRAMLAYEGALVAAE